MFEGIARLYRARGAAHETLMRALACVCIGIACSSQLLLFAPRHAAYAGAAAFALAFSILSLHARLSRARGPGSRYSRALLACCLLAIACSLLLEVSVL